jgi:pilus assembly protein CpaC
MRPISENNPMKNLNSTPRKSGALMKFSSCAAALLASLLVATPLLSIPTKATDMDVAQPGNEQSRFVRLGIGKSMVVHLPGEVKDVVVGDPSMLDAVVRNKNTAYLFARTQGQSNVFFLDANGQQIMALDVEISVDMLPLNKLLQRALPGTQIKADMIGRNVIVGGMASNPAEAKSAYDIATRYIIANNGSIPPDAVVDTIRIAGEDQVMLQVKVVEIQRDVLKQFGVDFRALMKVGNFAFNLSNINPFASNLLSPFGGAKTSYATGGGNFDSIIRAMESDGLVRTLAEPNLTAVSGQSASFLAGGEFPYQLCDVDSKTGKRTCEIKFKEYGVGLDFTPIVMDAGRISLKIHSSVSDLNSIVSGQESAPSLNKRVIDSTLELPDGGSMMMAGLISEKTRQNATGTPGLRKLPILGSLFRSRDFVSNETELVVIVTPHLVHSVAQQQLTRPDENFQPSSEIQANLMGHLNKIYGSAGKAPTGNYSGNVGFIVE